MPKLRKVETPDLASNELEQMEIMHGLKDEDECTALILAMLRFNTDKGMDAIACATADMIADHAGISLADVLAERGRLSPSENYRKVERTVLSGFVASWGHFSEEHTKRKGGLDVWKFADGSEIRWQDGHNPEVWVPDTKPGLDLDYGSSC